MYDKDDSTLSRRGSELPIHRSYVGLLSKKASHSTLREKSCDTQRTVQISPVNQSDGMTFIGTKVGSS
jgi:hypothetical protein